MFWVRHGQLLGVRHRALSFFTGPPDRSDMPDCPANKMMALRPPAWKQSNISYGANGLRHTARPNRRVGRGRHGGCYSSSDRVPSGARRSYERATRFTHDGRPCLKRTPPPSMRPKAAGRTSPLLALNSLDQSLPSLADDPPPPGRTPPRRAS